MKLILFAILVLCVVASVEVHAGHAKFRGQSQMKPFPMGFLRSYGHHQIKRETDGDEVPTTTYTDITQAELCQAANKTMWWFFEWLSDGFVLTENGSMCLVHSPFGPSFHLTECDMHVPEHLYSIHLLNSRDMGDGCALHDVTIDFTTPATGCSLAIVNQVLQVSCPPDVLPIEYRTLTLVPVPWSEPHNFMMNNAATYKICGERSIDKCSKDAYFLDSKTGKFVEAKYLSPMKKL